MTKILKYREHGDWETIAEEFLYQINNSVVLESENSDGDLNQTIKDIFSRLGFNIELTLTFGTGVKLMYPIVDNLIKNMNLQIQPSYEDVVLLCITVISIMFLNNKKNPPISSDDIKNKLNPEIQMKFGNPRSIVNKFVVCFDGIFNFINKFPKLFGVAMTNILDMFAYTSILLPVMNAISLFCLKYELTPDNLLGNLLSLGIGVMTVSARRLYNFVKSKVKNDRSTADDQEDVLSDVGDLQDLDMGKSKLIQEQ
jgi:hypothetical protein